MFERGLQIDGALACPHHMDVVLADLGIMRCNEKSGATGEERCSGVDVARARHHSHAETGIARSAVPLLAHGACADEHAIGNLTKPEEHVTIGGARECE